MKKMPKLLFKASLLNDDTFLRTKEEPSIGELVEIEQKSILTDRKQIKQW